MSRTYDMPIATALAKEAIENLSHAVGSEWSARVTPTQSEALLAYITELEEAASE